MEKTIPQQLEEIASEICDKYCKYPCMEIPEGKDDGWLTEEGSPCEKCPLGRLT